MAPGWPVTHLGAGGGYTQLSGTSIAAPFVTGSIALLWSLCPQAAAQQVHAAITQARSRKRGIVPPLLHVAGSKKTLENMIRS
jgi:subtilisin family serine protease